MSYLTLFSIEIVFFKYGNSVGIVVIFSPSTNNLLPILMKEWANMKVDDFSSLISRTIFLFNGHSFGAVFQKDYKIRTASLKSYNSYLISIRMTVWPGANSSMF